MPKSDKGELPCKRNKILQKQQQQKMENTLNSKQKMMLEIKMVILTNQLISQIMAILDISIHKIEIPDELIVIDNSMNCITSNTQSINQGEICHSENRDS